MPQLNPSLTEEKLTELLKQKQYVPMAAEEQVCVLFAGVKGYLDKVLSSEIGRFEALYLEHLRTKHQSLLDTIRKEGQLTPKTHGEIASFLEEFIPTSGIA